MPRYLRRMNPETLDNKGFRLNKLLNYFLQGLLVIAPIAITIYVLYSVVSFIDNQVPIFTARDEDGRTYVRNYGLGFILVIGAVTVVWLTCRLMMPICLR